MKNYRKIYEEYYNVKIPKGYHIHHKDFNRQNNDPLNLEMLTPDEHAQKHGYLNNWIMAQDKAAKVAIQKLQTPEIRDKMRQSMKNSEKHKLSIKKRSNNKEWYKNVSEACKQTAKNRTNEPWNKGKIGVQTCSDEQRKLYSEQRKGRKWYNDGTKSYFIHPQNALEHYNVGRKIGHDEENTNSF